MNERVTTERVRELMAEATPGPWTHEHVGFGGHEVTMDARHGVFVGDRHDAALIAAAPDLAADLLDARAQLAAQADELARLREDYAAAAHEAGRCAAVAGSWQEAGEALIRERDYWRETSEAQARLLAGKHTAEDGVSLLVMAVLDDAAQAPNHAEARGDYRGRRFALTVQWADGKTPGELIAEAQSEADALRAIVEGRTVPTMEDVMARSTPESAWSSWLCATPDGDVHVIELAAFSGRLHSGDYAGESVPVVVRSAVRWWALTDGRPCAWPVVGGG